MNLTISSSTTSGYNSAFLNEETDTEQVAIEPRKRCPVSNFHGSTTIVGGDRSGGFINKYTGPVRKRPDSLQELDRGRYWFQCGSSWTWWKHIICDPDSITRPAHWGSYPRGESGNPLFVSWDNQRLSNDSVSMNKVRIVTNQVIRLYISCRYELSLA